MRIDTYYSVGDYVYVVSKYAPQVYRNAEPRVDYGRISRISLEVDDGGVDETDITYWVMLPDDKVAGWEEECAFNGEDVFATRAEATEHADFLAALLKRQRIESLSRLVESKKACIGEEQQELAKLEKELEELKGE